MILYHDALDFKYFCCIIINVEAKRLPQHINLHCWAYAQKLSESSVAADGSLLFVTSVVQIQHERNDACNGPQKAQNRKQIRSYMHRLPSGKNSPRGLYIRLHSAPRGMTGNRLFYRLPLSRTNVPLLERWLPRTALYTIHALLSNGQSTKYSIFSAL